LVFLLLTSIDLMGQNCSTLATCNFENGSMPSSVGIMTNSTYYGPGVYSMRVLANLLDNVWVNYNNNYENPRNENEERRSIYYAQAADHDDESHDYDFLKLNQDDEIVATFKIYPNPNTGSFFISNDNLKSSNLIVKVYNGLGQLVEAQVQNLNGDLISVNLINKSKGLYFVEILSNQKIVGRSKLSLTE